MSESHPEALTRGRLLAKNTLLNLVGQGVPLIAGLIALPLLYRYLGADRYGILLLIWSIIGYSSLFDLGLSRALTKLIAEKIGEGRDQEVSPLVWTALLMMGAMGLAGTLLLGVALPWLVRGEILNVPGSLQDETVLALYLLAATVPFIAGTAGLRGVLEAYQRFDLINAIRVPFGLYNFIAPLLVLPFSTSLAPVVAVLAGGRMLALFVHAGLCFRAVSALQAKVAVERKAVGPLLHFGTWLSITIGGGTLIIYLERILIGSLLPVAAVGYFSTPYDLVIKVLIIPASLITVLFPAFSTHLAQDPPRATQLFDRGVRYVFIILFPIALVVITLAREALTLWMDASFAEEASLTLQWLMAGGFVSALSYLPVTLLHSAGRPDITGKLLLVYFPLYLLAVWWLLPRMGIEGAAMAHVIRLVLEGIALFFFASRYLPGSTAYLKRLALHAFAALPLFLVAALGPVGLFQKSLFLTMTLTTFFLLAWRTLLQEEERSAIRQRLPALRRPA